MRRAPFPRPLSWMLPLAFGAPFALAAAGLWPWWAVGVSLLVVGAAVSEILWSDRPSKDGATGDGATGDGATGDGRGHAP